MPPDGLGRYHNGGARPQGRRCVARQTGRQRFQVPLHVSKSHGICLGRHCPRVASMGVGGGSSGRVVSQAAAVQHVSTCKCNTTQASRQHRQFTL